VGILSVPEEHVCHLVCEWHGWSAHTNHAIIETVHDNMPSAVSVDHDTIPTPPKCNTHAVDSERKNDIPCQGP
jgi:hypothetical protein